MNQRDIIKEFLDGLIPDIQKSQTEKGKRASGASAASLRTIMQSDKLGQLIDGSGSFYFQVHGRRATSSSATKGKQTLKDIIYDWLQFKKYGLTWDTDKERKTLAFLISRKIHQKGYSGKAPYDYQEGYDSKLLSDIITEARLNTLTSKLADKFIVEYSSDIIKIAS